MASAHQDDPCRITITPEVADNPLGTTHTVTVTVTRKGGDLDNPQNTPGISCLAGGDGPTDGSDGWDGNVTFLIVSGPNAGLTETKHVDANGQATFTWPGNVAGTDTVQASLTYSFRDIVCDEPSVQNNNQDENCHEVIDAETLEVRATKNWIPPNPPVTPQVAPDVTMKISKKCVKTKFKLKPSVKAGSSSLTKAVLYIDGKKVKTSTTGKSFTINTARYSGGSHKVKLVSTFANGTVVVRSGKFKLCKARTTARRIDPRFTG